MPIPATTPKVALYIQSLVCPENPENLKLCMVNNLLMKNWFLIGPDIFKVQDPDPLKLLMALPSGPGPDQFNVFSHVSVLISPENPNIHNNMLANPCSGPSGPD